MHLRRINDNENLHYNAQPLAEPRRWRSGQFACCGWFFNGAPT
jgi:hypothetical protein